MSFSLLIDTLNRAADDGKRFDFWLRDDDAIQPTELLEKLLTLTAQAGVPLTLASIPADATIALADRIAVAAHVSVAVHGWNHKNYAPLGAKKQELGLHRGQDKVMQKIEAGLERISALFGPRSVAMLVPPWNRIDAALAPFLGPAGFRGLSVFGPEKRDTSIALLNTHVDVIDWKGNRGGRDADVLAAEVTRRIGQLTDNPLDTIGILTHHQDHDAAAWDFLERLFAHTTGHPACRWMRSEDILSAAGA
ncbi:polysaccharide deacetylase family protein [Rhizobium sp. XQZ8]|uniref:polysaccharide deacetylase family protein n=1 Tax=Rhizobium populisoli TaxID=2859785 RepID=UPI001CA55F45|nr:polysaccharide deacetylase family protein [Rhizobium populisoli]MBW6422396.1 polysaccharide deacetylase family protein [Rhizobium populisoli]